MYKASSFTGAFVLTLVVAMAASCSDDESVVSVAEDAGGGDATPAPSPDAAPPADAGNGDVVVETIQDPQIAQVLLTVSQAEIEQSRIVKDVALTTSMRDYAERIYNEYTAINERQVALFAVLGLEPVDSATSRQLQSEADAVLVQLQALPVNIERIYIDAQVAGHTQILGLIDRQLLPAASSAELESELRTLRDTVQADLDAARTVQETSGIPPQ